MRETFSHNGKLDLACGDNKRPGFTGIDKYKTASTDVEFDLLEFPWPIASDSVDEINCANFFEHVPAKQRTAFMEEMHRVMKLGAKALFITPTHDRMLQDPTHEWPPIVQHSYLYWSQDWLKANKLMHGPYVTTANFGLTVQYHLDADILKDESINKDFAIYHYNNATTDLIATLIKT